MHLILMLGFSNFLSVETLIPDFKIQDALWFPKKKKKKRWRGIKRENYEKLKELDALPNNESLIAKGKHAIK